MPTLLVIDDESSILHAFRRAFQEPEFTLHTAATAAEGVETAAQVRPDVVVLDVHLPDASGLEAFGRLRALDARTPVILITGHGTTELAIEAIKGGAYEYLLKPLELPQLRELVRRACESSRLMHVPALLPAEGSPPSDQADALLGRCPAMQEVYKAIGRVAPTDATALILGESGTGKELVARAIYQHSKRSERPFLAINCAAIPEALLESELFGHERGAFTGAERKRVGKFEQCSGGTLFLDEVGDMSPLTQSKLLRVLQEGRFERVGGSETVTADVRVIAATNQDLERLVTAGRFRSDLYFRLNVFTIQLPPLRERGEDLETLLEHYLKRFSRELGKPIDGMAPAAREALHRYAWPGNVRELQSVLKQAILRMSGSFILLDALPDAVRAGKALLGPSAEAPFDWDHYVAEQIAADTRNLYSETLHMMERELLLRVLKHTGGNQVQAARLLGITRGSLRTKIRALNIAIERSIWSQDDQLD
jgi:two-component system, NtrC family, response regulator AtoC